MTSQERQHSRLPSRQPLARVDLTTSRIGRPASRLVDIVKVKTPVAKVAGRRVAVGKNKENIPAARLSTPGSVRKKQFARKRQQRKPLLTAAEKIAMEKQFESLQEKLHVLKRESLKASVAAISSPNRADIPLNTSMCLRESYQTETKLEPASAVPLQLDLSESASNRSLITYAEELFSDKTFLEQCDNGLNATLQRTKDGATQETRIQELAGIVKTLRRCLRESMNRSKAFVEHAVKFERDSSQQVEAVKLSCESSIKRMEAELANAKRDVSQAQAAYKASAASWQSKLDYSQTEVCGLKRELERLENERDKAREEAKISEATRLSLEEQVRIFKREADQQIRELQVDKGEAQRSLAGLQQSFERREKHMQEALSSNQAKLLDYKDRARTLEEVLKEKSLAVQELQQQVEQLGVEKQNLCQQKQTVCNDLESHKRLHAKVVEEGNRVLSEFNSLQNKCGDLFDQLDSQAQLNQQLSAQLQDLVCLRQKDKEAQKLSCEQREAVQHALQQQLQQLQYEKQQLKDALSAAMAATESAETAANEMAAEVKLLKAQVLDLQTTNETLSADAAGLQVMADNLRLQEEHAQSTLQKLTAEYTEKASKLARLEGELEALQEVIGTGDQTIMVNQLVSKVATLEASVAQAETRRRHLHNQLVEMRGNIRVFCRVRPNPGSFSCVSQLPDGTSLKLGVDGKDHQFGFDRVFGPTSTQADIFSEVCELVQSALDGYKVCLFSYGQTGAGKTYTMQGSAGPEAQGIIPRTVHKILQTVGQLEAQGWEYTLEASFIEVYNESLRDLLAESKDAGRISDQNPIKHGADGGHTVVSGAVRLPISSIQQAEAMMARAASARCVESTAMNEVSSRSHSVFMLYITGRHAVLDSILHGALNLVDLAGSERLSRSQVEGQRQKEACCINRSLSSLGDVFAALAAKSSHIPYRNSKLTHLLQPCLGGDGKTLMFVNINPELASAQESLCSLRFAQKVNACETAAKGGAKRSVSKISTSFGKENAPSTQNHRLSLPAPSDPRQMSVAEPNRRNSILEVGKRKPAAGPTARATKPKLN